MKKVFFLSILFLSMSFTYLAEAQIKVNLNIGSQPAWGPTGYDRVDYYYLPDIDAYYNVAKKHIFKWTKRQKPEFAT